MDDQRIAILDALGLTLASKRLEAIAGRAASGIETEWLGDEEFYQGYDNENRHEFNNTASKPSGNSGGATDLPRRKGSTVFPNITQPYVDAASARVGDMLLRDRFFAIDPTPIPDILQEDEAEVPPAQAEQVPTAAPVAPPKPQRMITLPNGVEMPEDEVRKRFEQAQVAAKRKADKGQTRIDDWLVECQATAEMRKIIDDAAKLGSGVLKGPYPVNRKARAWRNIEGQHALVMVSEVKPASSRVDPWNLFPDPACGESIHNGAYIFERDYLTCKRLQALKGLPGYLNVQIDACLEEGAKQGTAGGDRSSQQASKEKYEVFYFHGEIKVDEMEAAGCVCEGGKTSYPVMVTMVNDRVIRAVLNPLDSGDFPYDVIPWKRRPMMPWGMGIARQMRTPQRIVTAATRNLMDNAGLAAGPQLIIRRGVEPQDGRWEMHPLKMWVEGDESDGQSGPPFLSVVIPMLQVELTNIIQLGMKLAEDVTGMPQLLQGNQGAASDTVGGMQILNANSNSVLRRIARLFDDCITVPHITRYYAFLMEYGEDDDEKGDFQIIARGSTALVELDIQTQEMPNILQMTLNPAFGADPKKAFAEYLKSRRFDPKAFAYTDEEQAQMEQQQPPPPPQIAVAQIRAQSAKEIEELRIKSDGDHFVADAQLQKHRIDVDTDRDRAYVEAEAEKNRNDSALRMQELQIKKEIEILKYSTAQKISLEAAKVQLAQTSMKLNVQKDLSLASHTMDLEKHRNPSPQVMTPPTEPKGRAVPGQAFAQ